MTDWQKHINEKIIGGSVPEAVTHRFMAGDSLADLFEDYDEDPRVLIGAWVQWLEDQIDYYDSEVRNLEDVVDELNERIEELETAEMGEE